MKKLFYIFFSLIFFFTSTSNAATNLSLWYHGAGNDTEKSLLMNIINDFNASQSEYAVVIEEFPQESYNDSVTAAALAGNLPDIIDVDGPIMPNWAWSGYFAPLNIDQEKLNSMLPGAIGAWNGNVYAVGLWDAACAIYARKSVLDENGIRIPTLDTPWTKDEFDEILAKLKATGKYDYVSNKADGTLNGDAGMAFGEWWQSLFANGYVPGTSQDGGDRETGFLDGKYALQLNGNWAGVPVVEKFGDDMLFLPSVDFGNGPKIGAASWQFGVSASSQNKEGANAFIEFAIQDKYLAAFSDGIGLIPPTANAAAMSEKYSPGGPLEVFFDLSIEYFSTENSDELTEKF